MQAFIDILRHSARSLRSRKQFTVFAAAILGAGIAANCAVFALINSLFLRELPYEDTERLVEISGSQPVPIEALSRAAAFTDVAAFSPRGFSVRTGDSYRTLYGNRVTPNLFQVLGVRAMIGRALEPADLTRPVVVLSYAYWRQISGDPNIIGQTLIIAEDQPRTIVGVLPQDFTLQVRDANVFVPAALSEGRVLARLRTAVTPRQAEQEAAAVFRAVPAFRTGRESPPRVTPIAQSFLPNIVRTTLLFQAAVALVLLITCANLANLLLVHGASRRREFAIRGAVGAGRGQLFAQLMTENAIIAAAGAGLGLILAGLSLQYLERSLPGNMVRMLRGAHGLSIDATVVGFTIALSVLTVLVFGLAPAVGALRFDVLSSLKQTKSISSPGSRRFGNSLAAVEVALAVVLLIAGGLTLKSLIGLYNRDLGFTAERVLRTPIDLPRSRYPESTQRMQALHALEERIRALPGVEAVAIAGPQLFPFGGPAVGGVPITIDGSSETEARAEFYYASPAYFRLLGIPLLRGRALTASDNASSVRVALASEVLARRYRLQEGQQIRPRAGAPPITIVGIAGNVRNPVGHDFTPVLYVPIDQTDSAGGTFYIRTTGEPMSIVPAVRREVLAADPNASELRVANLAEAVTNYVSSERFTTTVLGTFAFIGLLLAALGIFGVTRYQVSARVPEIGIRIALGASPRLVVIHVLGRSLVSVVIGVISGMAGAAALQKVIASHLHDVSPLDATVSALVILIVLVIATAAALLPARLAAKVDPAIALRQE